MPRILLTNDDGYAAPGIHALAEALLPLGELFICAPEHNCSGCGSSFTYKIPLTASKKEEITASVPCMAVSGTPVDAVKYALGVWMKDNPPDVVVSGINHGANIGRNVRYSGTLGALFEAGWAGFPTLAVSADWVEPPYWESAQHYAKIVVRRMLRHQHQHTSPLLLNLNVPAIPISDIHGLRVCRMGKSGYTEFITDLDPSTNEFLVRGTMLKSDAEGSLLDGALMHANYAALTPLSLDWTDTETLDHMHHENWEKEDE